MVGKFFSDEPQSKLLAIEGKRVHWLVHQVAQRAG